MGLPLCSEGREAPKAIRRNGLGASTTADVSSCSGDPGWDGTLGFETRREEQQDRRLSCETESQSWWRKFPSHSEGVLCVYSVHIFSSNPVILHQTPYFCSLPVWSPKTSPQAAFLVAVGKANRGSLLISVLGHLSQLGCQVDSNVFIQGVVCDVCKVVQVVEAVQPLPFFGLTQQSVPVWAENRGVALSEGPTSPPRRTEQGSPQQGPQPRAALLPSHGGATGPPRPAAPCWQLLLPGTPPTSCQGLYLWHHFI